MCISVASPGRSLLPTGAAPALWRGARRHARPDAGPDAGVERALTGRVSQGGSVLRGPRLPLFSAVPFSAIAGDGLPSAPLPPGELVCTLVVAAGAVDPGPALPLLVETVPAGFPSPADDYVEGRLDLLELTNAGSPSCYFLRVAGESMVGAGILDGDVIIVDRALEPRSGSVVVACLDNELTVKRFVQRGGRTMLLAANPEYPALEISGEQELIVWGVVTHSVSDHRRPSSLRDR